MDDSDVKKAAAKGRTGPAVKPGVVSVSNTDQLTTLDQRIAEKQAAGNVAKQKGRRNRATKPGVSDHNVERIDMDAALLEYEEAHAKESATAAGMNTLTQAEQDIAAKQKGRSTSNVPSKPGAFSANNSGGNAIGSELRGLEADVLAKQNAAGSRITSTCDKPNERLTLAEQDIAAKQQGRGKSNVPSKPGAFSSTSSGGNVMGSELVGLEADILAKRNAAGSRITSSSEQPSSRLTQAEQDIVTKQQGRGNSNGPSKPGAFSATSSGGNAMGSELVGLEADILAKRNAAGSRITSSSEQPSSRLTQAEQDIVTKQQGRGNSNGPSKPGAFSATSSGGDALGSELLGLEADVLAKQNAAVSRVATLSDSTVSTLTKAEQDISAKQKGLGNSAVPAKPGAFSAMNSGGSTVNSELSGREAAVLAKQSNVTKPLGGVSSDSNKGPPANFELNDLNDRIQAKMRDGALPSSTTVPSVLRDRDDRIQGKILADAKQKLPPVSSELRDFDDRVQTKISKETSIASLKSTVSLDIDTLDDRIQAKMRSGTVITPHRINEDVAVLSSQQAQPTWEIQRIDTDAEIKSSQVHRQANVAIQSLRDFENAAVMKLKGQVLSDSNINPSESEKQTIECKPAESADKNEAVTSGSLLSGPDDKNGLEYGEYGGDEEEGLAVAVAVEEGDDMYLPAAIEYDPDAKPPMYLNRRFRMYMCLAITAVFVGTIGAVLGITMTNEAVSQEIPYRTTLGIRENVARFVDNEELDDHTSPYRKALDWIMYTDPMAITPESPRFVQRYLLAYFYYATTVKKPWIECNPPVNGESETCKYTYIEDLLEDRKVVRNGHRWLTGSDECLWISVDCDTLFQVRGVELSGIGLTGKVPEGILKLHYFQQIIAGYGELEGTLPNVSKNLHTFDVRYNAITGVFPEQWAHSKNLQYIDVRSNNITGTILPGFHTMRDMKALRLDDNELVGTIHTSIGKALNLIAFQTGQNKLHGTIPTEIGNIAYMWSLDIFGNDLTGTIPSEMGKMTELEGCRMHNNLLTGPIPEDFWNAINIYQLHLFENRLNGTISGRINGLTRLDDLDIHSNQFTGNLPAKLVVRVINAGDNRFNGTVQAKICDATARGDIELLEMDCAAPPGGVAEVDCPIGCCTSCCQPDGGTCESPQQ